MPSYNYLDYASPKAPTGPFADLVPKYAQQYGVPLPVANWVGFNENGWREGANLGIPTSAGQAAGPWQFMPGTAKSFGIDPLNNDQSTMAAMKYLRQLYDKTGDWTSAVARYGTFSTGDKTLDQTKRMGFIKHALDSGVDTNSAGEMHIPPPTVPMSAAFSAPSSSTPQRPMSGSTSNYDPTSAVNMALQDPTNAGFFTPSNLLRLAAGFAGKRTIGQGISAAASGVDQGMQADRAAALQRAQLALGLGNYGLAQDRMGIDRDRLTMDDRIQSGSLDISRQRLGNDNLNAQINIGNLASSFMEKGMAPQAAIQAALAMAGRAGATGATSTTPSGTSPAPGATPGVPGMPPGMPDLSGVQAGGKASHGDLFYDPSGNSYRERIFPYGAPKYQVITGPDAGKTLDTLPQNSFRAQDAPFKALNSADAKAETGAHEVAAHSLQMLPQLKTISDLLDSGAVTPGPDMMSRLRTKLAEMNGGDTASANGALQSVMQSINIARMGAFKGYGQIRKAELDMLDKSGASFAQTPDAMKAWVDWLTNQNRYNVDMMDAWRRQGNRGSGFQNWAADYQSQNPMPQMDTSKFAGKRPPLSTFQASTPPVQPAPPGVTLPGPQGMPGLAPNYGTMQP